MWEFSRPITGTPDLKLCGIAYKRKANPSLVLSCASCFVVSCGGVIGGGYGGVGFSVLTPAPVLVSLSSNPDSDRTPLFIYRITENPSPLYLPFFERGFRHI